MKIESAVHTGIVRTWRGSYGFIDCDQGGSFFVHHTDIVGQDGYRQLEPGQRVTFEVAMSERGPKAINVQVAE